MIRNFSLDRLHAVDARAVGKCAFAAFNELQNYTPEQQAAAIATVMVLLHRKHRFNINDALNVGSNLLEKAGHLMPELRAAHIYVKEEM